MHMASASERIQSGTGMRIMLLPITHSMAFGAMITAVTATLQGMRYITPRGLSTQKTATTIPS